jgi:hypothetical protein
VDKTEALRQNSSRVVPGSDAAYCCEVAMGSQLSLVIANFFMEGAKEMALSKAAFKPTCWFRYVDDTFAIWPH